MRCVVYLKLPWIGSISRKFEKKVKSNVQNCFRAVDPRVIFQTRKILPSIFKDAVPITHQSMVVYQHVCRYDCRYVGRTSLRLQDRINQHIPKSIRSKENPTKVLPKRNCKITTPLNSGAGTYFRQGGLKIVRSCQRLGGEAPQTPLFSNARF